ncbi:MAG: ferredoxin domain-containing protein, partial [Planctomycetota bacterium]|nr:ferredoxin domain-containing protein [Planctomycetota bacterium]
IDLGIGTGSAVALAADRRVDNRVMFSAGQAGVNLKLFSPRVTAALGIPLSVSKKSPFYDRK